MARDVAAVSARIVRNPRILSGEPIVEGTRVPVRAIVVAWHYEPDISRMLKAYPHLSPEAIKAALAYYADHRSEIDEYIRANDADLD
ncbi:MAG TPA: DUF433 domain-containing protein [Chloroflexota bacterium]|nr:DUF433 domain-containing protein [Chloroflexota bacterium]